MPDPRDSRIVCPVCGEECTHYEATYWRFAGRSRHGRPLATCPNGHHVLPLDEAIAAGFVPPDIADTLSRRKRVRELEDA